MSKWPDFELPLTRVSKLTWFWAHLSTPAAAMTGPSGLNQDSLCRGNLLPGRAPGSAELSRSGRWAFLPLVPSSGLWFPYFPSAWRLVVLTLPRDCLRCQRRSWPTSILSFPARCFVTIKGWPGGQPPPTTELVPGCSWSIVGGGYESSC